MTGYNNGTLNGMQALKYETHFYCDNLYSTSALLIHGDTCYCLPQNNRSVRYFVCKIVINIKNIDKIRKWQTKVQRCQQQFDDISTEIKKEMERFELNRIREFKINTMKYIEDQMAHQQQIISYWETFIPSAREIV